MKPGWNSVLHEVRMKRALCVIMLVVTCIAAWSSPSAAQDRKLERIRIGGGAVSMQANLARDPALSDRRGVSVLLKTLEKAQPEARTANPEDFIDARSLVHAKVGSEHPPERWNENPKIS